MKEGYKIVAAFDCIVISKFLIPAVALINRIEQDVNIEGRAIALADLITALERLVSGRVIDDQDITSYESARLAGMR